MKITGKAKHSFVCSDTYTNKLLFINEEGVITNEIEDVIGSFDLWALPDGDILYTRNSGPETGGVVRADPGGRTVMHYYSQKEIFSCQPLENGNILLGLLGEPQLLEITSEGKPAASLDIPYQGIPHEGMRMARRINNGYYVVQPGLNKIRMLTTGGVIIKEFDIRPDAFGLVVKPDGHIVYTCMSGAYELDGNGREVWSLTAADVPEIGIRWLLGIQLLSNGNFVFTNWMGHGHVDEGVHIFEVDRQKNVVWSVDGRGDLGTPATVQILDEDRARVCYTPAK